MIHVLLIFNNGDALHGGIDVFPLLIEIQIVAGELPSKRKGMYLNIAIALLRNIGVVYQRSIVAIVLNLVVINYRVLFRKYLGYGIRQYGMCR